MRFSFGRILPFIIGLFSFPAALFAQGLAVGSGHPVRLVKEMEQVITLNFDLPEYTLDSYPGEAGLVLQRIVCQGSHRLLRKGAPDLPAFSRSVIIPDLNGTQLRIESSEFTEIPGVSMVPSKGNLSRQVDPASIPLEFGPVYQKNQFFPGELAKLSDPYIFRDFRGQTVQFFPFQYNPITKVLRVYQSITISVMETEETGLNPFLRSKDLQPSDEEFKSIYSRHFLNYAPLKYNPVNEVGSMLIISYGPFIPELQPFIQWKQEKGMEVTVVDVAGIGNANQIKSYVANLYNEKPFTFLLLVGDAAQVPTITATAGHSDPSYGYILGNDHYPEVLVGRFSAENAAQVQTQVQRVINYEKLATAADGFYSISGGVASSEGPGDDNQMDYEHIRQLLNQLETYNYEDRFEYYEGSQGGADAAGNPSAANVASGVNAGIGGIVYCGHGSDNSWGTSGFNNTNVNALTNMGKLPFIFSVACVNGNFVPGTCFGEAWLRASSNNTPKGAIAALMATINQSWNPPMEGQDEMIAVLIESYTNNIRRTFGGISWSGISKMNDSYPGTAGTDMADTWTIFGDPSLVLRTDTPKVVVVSHNPTIFLGANQFSLTCSHNGAQVCLSLNGQILGLGLVSNGSCTLGFNPISNLDTLVLTITGYNLVTYQAFIPVVPNNGPYVILDAVNTVDLNSNPAPLSSGGDFGLRIDLRNVGTVLCSNAVASISSSSPMVSVSSLPLAYGDISPASVSPGIPGFEVSISSSVPDQFSIPFILTIQDNIGNTWNSGFSLLADAPNPKIEYSSVSDPAGNNNGRLDPGETAVIDLLARNIGHFVANASILNFSSASPYVQISTPQLTMGNLDPQSNHPASFEVFVLPNTPVGTVIPFSALLQSGSYQSEIQFTLRAGLVLEDWESNGFSSFGWVNNGTYPWIITQTGVYEGAFAARSADIGASQSSTLSLTVEVGQADSVSFFKKVSSEQDYDFLRFYVDNVKKGEWSGEVNWSAEQYPLSPGTHTLKWVYSKDNYYDDGQDAAFIDFIVLPPANLNEAPFITSLPDTTILAGTQYQYDFQASDPNSDNLQITPSALPSWLSLTVTGNGTASLTGTPANAQVGNHTVQIAVSDGIAPAVNQSFQIRVIHNVSFQWVNHEQLMLIPNPSSGFFRIQGITGLNAELRLLDVLGKEIRYLPLVTEDQVLDFGSLEQGIYFVRIQVDRQNHLMPLIIRK